MAAVALEVSGVTWDVGARAAPEHGTPPRVTWVPDRDRPGVPRKYSRTSSGRRSRAVVGMWELFEVHCWGADYDATVALRDSVLRVVHRLCTGAWRHEGGEWARPGAVSLGEMSVQRIALLSTVFDAATVTAHVTSVGLDTVTDTPGDGQLEGVPTP